MSYEIPLNKEKAGIPKWLEQKLKDQGKDGIQPKLLDFLNKKDPNLPEIAKTKFHTAISKLKETFKEPPLKKIYEKRHIFAIADG